MLRTMRRFPMKPIAAGLCLIALSLSGCTNPGNGGEPSTRPSTPAVGQSCRENQQPISRTLSSGASWAMCWSVDPKLGLVLSDIKFGPGNSEVIPVISRMSLAQLEVPYDSGKRLTSDITSAGFGGTNMHTITESECPAERLSIAIPNVGDGSKFGSSPVREVLCSQETDSALSYRSGDLGQVVAKRKQDWQLSTISKVGWYEYVNQVTFGADGSISPALGATGDLSPVDYTDKEHGWPVGPEGHDHAASHSHNAVWKIDWALGGEKGQKVEQFDAKDTGKLGTDELGKASPIVNGSLTPLPKPATARWTDRRWWRVVAPGTLNADKHPISYQIDMAKTDRFTFVDDAEHHGSDTGYDVAFTNADECQVFATMNRGRCGRGVPEYVELGKGQQLDDVVSWVAVGYHHVPRDEDQSPMEMHWQGFNLLPRDLTSRRVDVPQEREFINGKPEEWEGQMPPDE